MAPAAVDRVEWSESFPADVRAIVAPYVRAIAPFVPTEYHDIFLLWDASDSDAVARTECKRQYREVGLTICPAFLSKADALRRHIIVHEVVHTILEPMDRVATRAIEALSPDEADDGGPWTDAHIDAVELVTQDLARHILKLIPESAWRADG